MKSKGIIAAALACLVLGLGAVTAEAATVNSFLQNGLNKFSDENAEYLAVDANNDQILDIGDVIVGGIAFNTINGNAVVGSGGHDQLTGVFALQVKDLLNVSGPVGFQTADIIFEPWAGFSAYVAGLDTDPNTGGQQAPAGPAIGAGTIARLWTKPPPYTNNFLDIPPIAGSPASNVGTAATGAFYWDLGFAAPALASQNIGGTITSLNGEGWVALGGGTNIGSLQFELDSTTFAPGNFGVSILQVGVGLPTIQVNPTFWTPIAGAQIGANPTQSIDVFGSSTVRGALNAEANAGFLAGSDTNFSFNASVVPLPGAAWMGIALLAGLGAARIRRRKNS